MKALNLTTGMKLAGDVTVADGLISRMKGLLGLRSMPAESALLIIPCKGIHTFGMRFRLDVIFLDRRSRVIALRENLAPNRLSAMYLRAKSVIEIPAGTIAATRTRIGDEIEIA